VLDSGFLATEGTEFSEELSISYRGFHGLRGFSAGLGVLGEICLQSELFRRFSPSCTRALSNGLY
jgi:hypothetical protein